MSKIPTEILRHKTPGTEIKRVGTRYYIQRVKGVWDPAKKKPVKKIVEYIGRVTAEGIQPKQKRIVEASANIHSKEFGATWVAREFSADVRECLQKHFGNEAGWIYTAALLRCVHPCAMRYLEHRYAVSWLSEAMPGLDMRSETLSAKMKSLGMRRDAIGAFMKEFVPSKDWYAIFDATSILCKSEHIREAQRGYNPRGSHAPQINLMYALALKDKGLAPVFYKRYPGNIRDVGAFRNMANAMGLESALVLADKAFAKKAECERLAREGLSYILPLRRNSLEYSREALQKPGRTGFEGRFLHNGRMVWYSAPKPAEGAAHRCCLYLDESLHHAETTSRGTDKIGRETPASLLSAAHKQLEYGTFALKTNLMDCAPEDVYRTYKTRGEVEQLFDMYKSEEQFATTGMHSSETQEACLFINHLCLMIAYRIYERLKRNEHLREYAVQKTLEHLLYDIRATRFGSGQWQFEPVPKAARRALEALELTLPETPQ